VSINRRTFLRRALVSTLGGALATGCAKQPGQTPLGQAVQFLWAQQATDGGFHSTTYGLLRSGQSLTPFVLLALLSVPDGTTSPPPGALERGLAFIRAHTQADGSLGLQDDAAADYPNYATALAVSALVKAQRPGYERSIEPMVAQLRAQQFAEANGWTPQDAPYGGWGMGGALRHPPEAGHVDLSMTRYVLEALRLAGVPPTDPVMKRALVYLERSQNADGGFFFSPVNPEINKAGAHPAGGFASYGSATADGALALRAVGLPDTAPRLAQALKWLAERHQPDRVPGFAQTAAQPWDTGLRFYYAHAIARLLPHLPIELPPPAPDGSHRNANPLVKEDDPLIATAFALYVLAR
jgi:hypothetical protein